MVLKGLEGLPDSIRGGVVTLGNFDGVHLGHRKILHTALEMAQGLHTHTLALTFDPHPVNVLSPERAPRLLTNSGQRAELLGRYGARDVVVAEFNRDFASLTPDEFIGGVLVERLGVRGVVVGHNYAFGRGKAGTTDLLRRRGARYGFKVRVARHVTMYRKVVSSSRIRTLLGKGNVRKAAELLGRFHEVEGTVGSGHGRGANLLSTPTANLLAPGMMLPRAGVYAVRARLAVGGLADAVCSIGHNPTFASLGTMEEPPTFEVHLMDFERNLRGESMRVEFIERLRDECAFPSVDALKARIGKDIEEARAILAATPRG